MTESLSPGLYPLALMILMTVLSTAIGIIAFFIKDIRNTLSEDQRRQDEAIDSVRQDLNELKSELPREYVMRDDFIRAMASLDHKIDRMAREIKEISRVLNRIAGIAGDANE